MMHLSRKAVYRDKLCVLFGGEVSRELARKSIRLTDLLAQFVLNALQNF